jgi:hypothetical protein
VFQLGREDSNLQLPKSRGRLAQRRAKQDKNLSETSNAEKARGKRKTDPETVTQPSPPRGPTQDR